MAQVDIYTDGANSWGNKNAGHAGIGVLIMFGNRRITVSKYIGIATNNIAELMAIKVGLTVALRWKDKYPVQVYSDSAYAIGILTNQTWVPKANIELVAEIRALLRRFPALRFIKVKGHSGNPWNDTADRLAGQGKRAGQEGRPDEGVTQWIENEGGKNESY